MMNTREALAELGISPDDLTVEQRRQFDEQGYFIVPDVFSPSEVTEMLAEFERLISIEGKLVAHVIEFGGIV